jgi:YVTN family beta-propeller protein
MRLFRGRPIVSGTTLLMIALCACTGVQATSRSAPSRLPPTDGWSEAIVVGNVVAHPPKVPSRIVARPRGIYGAIHQGQLAPTVRRLAPRVYVPNNDDRSVSVIDPRTYRVVRTLSVGSEPQHITPSWDLRHLYVGNVYSGSLSDLDPRTRSIRRTIAVPDPYNLYFTPDGHTAIDVAEGRDTLFFFDPTTWKERGSLTIPFRGPDHLDFSPHGRFLLLSTEYAGTVVKVGLDPPRIRGAISVGGSAVDVKISPDGRVFFVANQERGGVSIIDSRRMREIGFIATGAGAHGFAMARDGRHLYVANRLAGTISIIDTTRRLVVHTWRVGLSPDMLQVSADGSELWASDRFDSAVSVIATATGRVLHVIPVGGHPHGLTFFPQPGRFSIGHNGVYR